VARRQIIWPARCCRVDDEAEPVANLAIHAPVCDRPQPNLRPAQINQNGQRTIEILADLTNPSENGFMPVTPAVGHVEPEHRNAGLNELSQSLGRFTRRTDGRNNLGLCADDGHGGQTHASLH